MPEFVNLVIGHKLLILLKPGHIFHENLKKKKLPKTHDMWIQKLSDPFRL